MNNEKEQLSVDVQEDQIKTVEESKICAKCGTPVSEDQSFCPKCGRKVKQGKASSLKKWIVSNKKKAIIILTALILIVAAIVTVVVVNVVKDSRNESTVSGEGSSTEETLKTMAERKAGAYYKLKYDATSVTINVASVTKMGSQWRVAGKVTAIDAYGDKYVGNWSIMYDVETLDEEESDFGVPKKSS